jgi:hypothetical protein
MAQYKDGNAKITAVAPTVVVLDTGVTTDNIQAGDLFRFQSDTPDWYQVASIVDASSFALSAPYTGAKAFDTFFEYVVTRDFTPIWESQNCPLATLIFGMSTRLPCASSMR